MIGLFDFYLLYCALFHFITSTVMHVPGWYQHIRWYHALDLPVTLQNFGDYDYLLLTSIYSLLCHPILLCSYLFSSFHPFVHSFIHSSFIHSGYFYNVPSSPLLLRGAPDYSIHTVPEFTRLIIYVAIHHVLFYSSLFHYVRIYSTLLYFSPSHHALSVPYLSIALSSSIVYPVMFRSIVLLFSVQFYSFQSYYILFYFLFV